MSSPEFVKLALQLAAMLLVALAFGEILRRFGMPAVVGEMFGGVLLGPTAFGLIAPSLYAWLFLSSDAVVSLREAATKLGMLFFLFLAGLEVDLSDFRTLGRRIVLIGLIGTLLPIVAGVGLVYALPGEFWGPAAQAHFLVFALFVGMNLANSANPVIARILMDLGLLQKPIGTVIMSATVVDDLVNWTLFAIILSDIAPSGATASGRLIANAAVLCVFFAVVLGVGRWLGPPALRYARAHLAWPSGLVALTALVILLAASAAEALGIHAFLGAYLAGAALGGRHDHQKDARDAMSRFVMSFFAPLYFVSIGMSANFVRHFDPVLVAFVLVAACVTKVGSVLIGVWAAGLPLNREAWAIGFGLNARGATGVILAGVGLANGIIDDRVFVAMVVMAIATSMMSAPVMSRLLSHHGRVPVPRLAAVTD